MNKACVVFDQNFKVLEAVSDKKDSPPLCNTSFVYKLEASYNENGIQTGITFSKNDKTVFILSGDKFMDTMTNTLNHYEEQDFIAATQTNAFMQKDYKKLRYPLWVCSLWYIHMVQTRMLRSTQRIVSA